MAIISGAIIDMDGTLLDSMWLWEKIDRQFLEEKRGITVPADYMQAISAMSYRETALYTIARFGLTDTPEELMAEWDRLALAEYENTIQPKPWAMEFLLALRMHGIKTVLCTSSPELFYAPALIRLGLYPLFDAYVTTGEAGKNKSFPDVYLLAAERIGVPPQLCAAFEDIPEAISGVHGAGMRICGVYDDYSKRHSALMRKRCDWYVENLGQAIEIFSPPGQNK